MPRCSRARRRRRGLALRRRTLARCSARTRRISIGISNRLASRAAIWARRIRASRVQRSRIVGTRARRRRRGGGMPGTAVRHMGVRRNLKSSGRMEEGEGAGTGTGTGSSVRTRRIRPTRSQRAHGTSRRSIIRSRLGSYRMRVRRRRCSSSSSSRMRF